MRKIALCTLLSVVFCLLTVLLYPRQAEAVTEFISVIDTDNWAGTDYTSLTSWEASNQVDLTATDTLVYGGTLTGFIADGAGVTLYRGGSSQSVTATVVHANAAGTQILLRTISNTSTPLSGDEWRVDAGNLFTITDIGDSAISVAKTRAGAGVPDVTAVTIDGWTTSATNYIKVWTDSTELHRHQGVWNTVKYRMTLTAAANDTYLMNFKENYGRIEGLQFELTNSGGYTGVGAINLDAQVTASDIRISSNIIKGVISGANSEGRGIYANDADITSRIYNNIIYDFANGTTANNSAIETALGGTHYLYNNTLHGNYEGLNVDAGTVVAKNNLVTASGDTLAYIGTFAAGTNYNATDGTDAIGVGANNRVSQTFTFADEANDDFHLAVGDTGAKDFAEDLSADANLAFSVDLDLVTRSGSWDIGADEYNIIPTLDSVTVSTINAADDTITLTFSEAMDTSTITNGVSTLVIRYDDDGAGTNEVIIPTTNATVVWSGGNTIATITLDGS